MKIILSIALLGLSNICLSQQIITNTPISTQLTNNGNFVSLVDMNGKPFKSADTDVKGTVFLNDNWQKGNIQLADGTIAKNISLKINLLNNYVHFLNDKGIEMYKEANETKTIEILQLGSLDSVIQVFKTYEVEKNGKTTTRFYEQLTNGHISLLKLLRKELKTSTNEFTKEITKEFVQYQDYYIFSNNSLIELKRKQSFFETIMNSKWKIMEKYIDNNNTSFKSIGDIKGLIEFFNTN